MEYTFYKDDLIIGVLECLQGLADKKEGDAICSNDLKSGTNGGIKVTVKAPAPSYPFPEDCSNWLQD